MTETKIIANLKRLQKKYGITNVMIAHETKRSVTAYSRLYRRGKGVSLTTLISILKAINSISGFNYSLKDIDDL